MEIVIHGTKGGYKNNFIPYATSSFAVGDIRRGSADENPVGQSAYSIAFDNKGYIITKYIIIRDTLRSYAVGFIGFSLFLPADKELSGKGASIQSLLDEVSDLYKEHYIKSNNINCDKTTLIQEDWSFISQITAKYQEQNNPNEEQIDSISHTNAGTEFPAFIYYSSDKGLQKYFDTPFQEEYKNYQQVLFIKAELKDKKENPLYILRNSGYNLTEKIDLVNPIYKIVINSQSLKSINDTSLSLFDKRIRIFNHLRLKWSKQYYSDIMKEIVISEANNDPSVSIDHAKHIIMIQEPTEWLPQTKTIKIEVVDYYKNPIKDAQIYTEDKTTIPNGVFTLEGENIGKSWRIYAKHGELKGEGTIQPNSQDRIRITLHKSKDIELKINNNGDEKRYTIRYEDSLLINVGKRDSYCYSLIFRDSAIDKPFDFEILGDKDFRQKGSFIPNDIKEKEYRIDLENLPQLEKPLMLLLKKTNKNIIVISSVSVLLLIIIGIIVLYQNFNTSNETIANSDKNIQNTEGNNPKTDSLDNLEEHKECGKIEASIERTKITDSINSKNKRIKESDKNPKEPKYIVEYLTRSQEFSLDSISKYYSIPGLSRRMNSSLKLIKDFINETVELNKFISQATVDSFIQQNPHSLEWAKNFIRHKKEDIAIQKQHTSSFIQKEILDENITIEELAKLKESNTSNYSESITLYLLFWEEAKNADKKKCTFDNLLQKIDSDPNLKRSPLRDFLHLIAKTKEFDKFRQIKGVGIKIKSISQLKIELNKQ